MEEEETLRRSLVKLEEHIRVSDIELDESPELRAAGVDVSWAQWAHIKRERLQREFALIAVRNASQKQQLLKALGRKSTIEDVMSAVEDQDRRSRSRKSENDLREIGLLDAIKRAQSRS
ncbi:MAG: hypothetical protein ACU0BB_15735 [Paracoccaceae bacterium]